MAYKYELNLRDYIRILRKRKWVILFTFVIIVISSILYTRSQTPIYEASAAIKIERKLSIAQSLFEVFTKAGQNISTLLQIIQSREIAAEVVELLGLAPKADREKFNAMVSNIRARISARQRQNTDIIDVRFRDTDPRRAAEILNTLCEVFIAENEFSRKRNTRTSRVFVQQQLDYYRKKLKEDEERLRQFKVDNKTIGVDAEINSIISRISEYEIQLVELNTQIKNLQYQLNNIRATYRKVKDISTATSELRSDPVITQLKQNLIDMEFEVAKLLREYTEKHPRVVATKVQIEKIKKKIQDRISSVYDVQQSSIEAQILSLQVQKEIINSIIRKLNKDLERYPKLQVELGRLERNVKVDEKLYAMFREKLEQIKITEVGELGSAVFLERAVVPKAPIKPNKRLNFMIGVMLGIILGIAFAFIAESIDTSIGTIEDVESYTQLPVLGIIPHIRLSHEILKLSRKRRLDRHEKATILKARLITKNVPKSPISEAYRSLRTNLQFIALKDRNIKTLLLTSSGPQEGKTTTVTNLSVTMAQGGNKTLLVSSNLRRPEIFRIFDLPRTPGLTDILAGQLDWHDTLKETDVENLYVITSGPLPPNPVELLQSEALDKLISEARKEFDIIIFDSPPVLPVADASIIASKVDGVLLVYSVGKAGREVLMRAKVQLQNAGAKIWGIVLNDIKAETDLGTTYYYYHYASATKPEE